MRLPSRLAPAMPTRLAQSVPGRLALVALAAGTLVGWFPPGQTAIAAAGTTGASAQITAATLSPRTSAPSGVHALGAALENQQTGQLLWSRAANTKRPIGSITKVMTALVVLRAGDLNRELTVSQAAVSYARENDGSTAGLHAGDKLTAEQLLEAMLVPSGCDAAYVLASAYGPGIPAFVAKMNALARQLGLGHTHFANADGLPVPTEHSTYSTPADLLVIARDAMTYPMFRAIVAAHRFALPAGPGHHAYIWHTTNQLISKYPGMIGIKTGSTLAAGYCFLFADQRGSGTLIGVVLDSSSISRSYSFTDAEQLLNWGFG
jgi:D-alanyl-D-alanine carboxypeptidase (penicillin-binding protein 5/6)